MENEGGRRPLAPSALLGPGGPPQSQAPPSLPSPRGQPARPLVRPSPGPAGLAENPYPRQARPASPARPRAQLGLSSNPTCAHGQLGVRGRSGLGGTQSLEGPRHSAWGGTPHAQQGRGDAAAKAPRPLASGAVSELGGRRAGSQRGPPRPARSPDTLPCARLRLRLPSGARLAPRCPPAAGPAPQGTRPPTSYRWAAGRCASGQGSASGAAGRRGRSGSPRGPRDG